MRHHIGGLAFPSKRAIEKHVRSILEQTQLGCFLSGSAFKFVRDLIDRHPHAELKIGPGIQAIRVDLNVQWTARKMFTLVRSDGSETDVSYRVCLYPQSPRQNLAEACRQTVVDDVLAFKRSTFDAQADNERTVLCPLTCRRVDWHATHVDHAPPWTFCAILDAFIRQEGINPIDVKLRGDEDGEVRHSFADAELGQRFRMFHNQRAHLRVVAKEANLALARPGLRDCQDAA